MTTCGALTGPTLGTYRMIKNSFHLPKPLDEDQFHTFSPSFGRDDHSHFDTSLSKSEHLLTNLQRMEDTIDLFWIVNLIILM